MEPHCLMWYIYDVFLLSKQVIQQEFRKFFWNLRWKFLPAFTFDLPLKFEWFYVAFYTGVGAGGEEQKASSISMFQLPWLAFVVSILFVGIKPHAPTHNSFLFSRKHDYNFSLKYYWCFEYLLCFPLQNMEINLRFLEFFTLTKITPSSL